MGFNSAFKGLINELLFVYWAVRAGSLFIIQVDFRIYRGADKSLAGLGREKANVSVGNGVNFIRRFALQKKKDDDSSRLDVVEIACVTDVLPSLFPSWSG